MKQSVMLAILLSCMVITTRSGIAQEKGTKIPAGFRGEFLTQLMDDEKKVVDLAEAVPDTKYGWRPSEGVRSIGEVYVHIASANYGFPKMIGVKPPENLVKDPEKNITDKKEIIAFLKGSFAYVRSVAMKTSDAELDKPANFYGEETTVRGILFHLATHLHEHLGQSIAYARTNNVVPPWTAAEMKQQDSKK